MNQDQDDRAKLIRLADALLEDILGMSDADILSDTDPKDIEQARLILTDVKSGIAHKILSRAKDEMENWRSIRSTKVASLDRTSIRDQFENLRRNDPAFNKKVTLAARNGQALTDADVEGLISDWDDLQRLEGPQSE